MIPILLVSNEEKSVKTFLERFKKENEIANHFTFEIYPKGKEISIDQIREIKKNTIFNFSEKILIVFHQFETASFEAQNAFLKTLEEHSENIQFILVVNNYHSLAPTILSRSKVIQLKKTFNFEQDTHVNESLKRFLTSGNLIILSDKYFQIKSYETSAVLFQYIVSFFQKRLPFDPLSPRVLREAINQKHIVENNNVNPQSAIDHLLIFIRALYQAPKK